MSIKFGIEYGSFKDVKKLIEPGHFYDEECLFAIQQGKLKIVKYFVENKKILNYDKLKFDRKTKLSWVNEIIKMGKCIAYIDLLAKGDCVNYIRQKRKGVVNYPLHEGNSDMPVAKEFNEKEFNAKIH